MRLFNTVGPVRAEDHCAIPPLGRGKVDEVLALIRDKPHFVRAPRQIRKITTLIALRDLLNGEGDFRGMDANVEVCQVAH